MPSHYIELINTADQLVGLFIAGYAPAIIIAERLASLGFYQIQFDGSRVSAMYNGVRWPLGRA